MKIRVKRPAMNFTMVPNHVLSGVFGSDRKPLSAEAIGVLVFVMSHPDGFELRVGDIQERFDYGKDKWRRVRAELVGAGALASRKGGLQGGETLEIQWPDELTLVAENQRVPENPAAGKTDPQPAENPQYDGLETRPPLNKKKYKTLFERGADTHPRRMAVRALVDPSTTEAEYSQVSDWLRKEGVDIGGLSWLRSANKKAARIYQAGKWDVEAYGEYTGPRFPE